MLNKCKIKQFIRECENATFRIDELDLLYSQIIKWSQNNI